MPHPLTGPVVGFFARLEHPTLLRITLVLMALSWLLPDPLPFLDEIATALAVTVLANWRKRRESPPVAAAASADAAGGRAVIEGEARVIEREPPAP